MLQSFTIENYILVDYLQFDLKKGLSVITGETGAGKSIFLQALSLLSGEKNNRPIAKDITKPVILEAIFSGIDKTKLETYGLLTEDETTIVTRQITGDNKSTMRINGRLVSLTIARDILANEIDIHSQFKTIELLDESFHLTLIDQWHQNVSLMQKVKESYHSYLTLKKELEQQQATHLSPIELLQYQQQLDELNQFKLSVNEELTIKEQLNESKQQVEKLDLYRQLTDEIDTLSLKASYKALQQKILPDELELSLQQLMSSVDEVRDQLNQWQQKMTILSTEALDELNHRSYQYSQLKRKYGMDVVQLIEYRKTLEDKIAYQQDQQFYLAEKNKAIQTAYQQYSQLSDQLHTIRMQAAAELSDLIMQETKALALPHFMIKAQVAAKENELGQYDIYFVAKTNLNQEFGRLKHIASGGELSRIMLALKVVFNKLLNIQLMIFDEIDSGVSGNIVGLMAQKIKQLTDYGSCIVVTHLPIMAAYGDYHYQVVKAKNQITIQELNDRASKEAIAQLLAGEINEESLTLAAQLKENAHG